MHISPLRLALSALFGTVFTLIATASAFAADTTRPVIGSVSPVAATVGTPVSLSASYSDNTGVTSCTLYVEFQDEGSMTLNSGVASRTYTFPTSGVYTVFVYCKDAAGNGAHGSNTAVVVSAASGSSDATPPTVGSVSPLVAQKNVAVTFSATNSDASGVTTCRLMVSGFDQGSMTLSGGVASKAFTFDATGSYSVYAKCYDPTGNAGSGAPVTVTVSDLLATPAPVDGTATPGLVKILCPSGAAVDHTCHSVYYRSADGQRHAFPNEKVYFTWYVDFQGITEISATDMAALPLGHNVTYRPGVRMVKFTTDNKVYAVDHGGVLRWVSSEATAIALYGSDWNKKIDDISDVFVGNYSKGSEITSAADYSPSAAMSSATTIEENF